MLSYLFLRKIGEHEGRFANFGAFLATEYAGPLQERLEHHQGNEKYESGRDDCIEPIVEDQLCALM